MLKTDNSQDDSNKRLDSTSSEKARQTRNLLGIIASVSGLICIGLLSSSKTIIELEAIEGPLIILLDLITAIFTAHDLIPFAEQIGEVFHKFNQSIRNLMFHPLESLKNLSFIILSFIFAVNWFKNFRPKILKKEVPLVSAFHIIRAHLTNAFFATPIAFSSWFTRTSLIKIFSSISISGGILEYFKNIEFIKPRNLSLKHEVLNVIPSFAFLKSRISQSLLYLVLAALPPLRNLVNFDFHEFFDAINFRR